jgi:hypothetical protein
VFCLVVKRRLPAPTQRGALGRPLALHARDIVAGSIVTCVVTHGLSIGRLW